MAHIKDYYAFEVEGGEKRFDIEHALGELEDEAIPAIRKTGRGESLSGEDRQGIQGQVFRDRPQLLMRNQKSEA